MARQMVETRYEKAIAMDLVCAISSVRLRGFDCFPHWWHRKVTMGIGDRGPIAQISPPKLCSCEMMNPTSCLTRKSCFVGSLVQLGWSGSLEKRCASRHGKSIET